mmetsp:Transcript_15725/g.61419  ORF Transcript_15725/g.61419 Transcript_15725/m.61419 type:complete len:403 (-) Transcript_15725:56-1264(-)
MGGQGLRVLVAAAQRGGGAWVAAALAARGDAFAVTVAAADAREARAEAVTAGVAALPLPLAPSPASVAEIAVAVRQSRAAAVVDTGRRARPSLAAAAVAAGAHYVGVGAAEAEATAALDSAARAAGVAVVTGVGRAAECALLAGECTAEERRLEGRGAREALAAAAVVALLERWRSGGGPAAGAREVTAAEAEVTPRQWKAAARQHSAGAEAEQRRGRSVFEAGLGARCWAALPLAIRALHDVAGQARASGTAVVERGTSALAAVVCALFRFPQSSPAVPVTVTMTSDGVTERWERNFGGAVLTSHLRPAGGEGAMFERFPPVTFRLHLHLAEQGGRVELRYDVISATLLGVPLPRFLLPVSSTAEYVDDQGRFCFDVDVSLPLGLGRLVRYRGCLVRDDEM